MNGRQSFHHSITAFAGALGGVVVSGLGSGLFTGWFVLAFPLSVFAAAQYHEVEG